MKAHGLISTDTLTYWIKLVLASAGIDAKRLTAHSNQSSLLFSLSSKEFIYYLQISLMQLDGRVNI